LSFRCSSFFQWGRAGMKDGQWRPIQMARDKKGQDRIALCLSGNLTSRNNEHTQQQLSHAYKQLSNPQNPKNFL
jgi:hypothetical protein